MAICSSVEINDAASMGGDEADRAASVETTVPDPKTSAAMVDRSEYWIG